MSSDTLLQKFEQLNAQAQDQLLAFWEFLLAQSSGGRPGVMSEAYRRQIEGVGVWSEEDERALSEAASAWHWPRAEW